MYITLKVMIFVRCYHCECMPSALKAGPCEQNHSQTARRKTDHTNPFKRSLKSVAPQFHTLPYRTITKFCLMMECTIQYGEWQFTALFGSTPVCQVNSGVGVT